MHKQLNSKRHMTMVPANLNSVIQRPRIWWFLAGVFLIFANSNIFSTFWNSESLLKKLKNKSSLNKLFFPAKSHGFFEGRYSL